MVIYYIYVDLWKKFKNEFSFVSFEQYMEKKIYFSLICKKNLCKYNIYINFHTFYHKAK
jgi:hypothetical protein